MAHTGKSTTLKVVALDCKTCETREGSDLTRMTLVDECGEVSLFLCIYYLSLICPKRDGCLGSVQHVVVSFFIGIQVATFRIMVLHI